jgi:hypothetical protein
LAHTADNNPVLDRLLSELKTLRVRAIARDLETRLNTIAETELECARVGVTMDDVEAFFRAAERDAMGGWPARHYARLADCVRTRGDLW